MFIHIYISVWKIMKHSLLWLEILAFKAFLIIIKFIFLVSKIQYLNCQTIRSASHHMPRFTSSPLILIFPPMRNFSVSLRKFQMNSSRWVILSPTAIVSAEYKLQRSGDVFGLIRCCILQFTWQLALKSTNIGMNEWKRQPIALCGC